MSSRVSLQPAFVLHSRLYGDSSLIYDAFCRDFGRISLLGKGYRKKNKYSAPLYTPMLLSWSGRGDMKTLTSAEANGTSPLLTGRQLYAALYINELLSRLLPKLDPHLELFNLYQQLIPDLVEHDDFEPVLRQFEFHLLSELGYAINLDHDTISGGEILAEGHYRYVSESGFFAVAADERSASGSFLGKDLLAIAEGDFSTLEVRRAAKRLSRLAFAPLLGNRPLKSRELFLQQRAPIKFN